MSVDKTIDMCRISRKSVTWNNNNNIRYIRVAEKAHDQVGDLGFQHQTISQAQQQQQQASVLPIHRVTIN